MLVLGMPYVSSLTIPAAPGQLLLLSHSVIDASSFLSV